MARMFSREQVEEIVELMRPDGYDAGSVDEAIAVLDERDAVAAARSRYTRCPTCGGQPIEVSIGMILTKGPGTYSQMSPNPQGPRLRCENDHWYDEQGKPAGPPVDIHAAGPGR